MNPDEIIAKNEDYIKRNDFSASNSIVDYLGQADVAYDTAPGDWKAKIAAQKWIALYMQGYKAWAEYRREWWWR